MNSTHIPLRGLALALCLSASCALAAEWAGTMSCGELQNSPNAKSKEPFTGKVTLRVEGNRAVLERRWKNGAERSEGTVVTGRPLQLVGSGSFTATPDKPWKVRAILAPRDDRYRGLGVLESPDGTRKFRDCSFDLVSTGSSVTAQPSAPTAAAVPSTQPASKPLESPAATEPRPTVPQEPPKAAEAPSPAPAPVAAATVPPPVTKEAKPVPAKSPAPAIADAPPSFGFGSLAIAFLLGGGVTALAMTLARRRGHPQASIPPAPPATAATAQKATTGFMDTVQGLMGLVVLVALAYWGYNKLFGQAQNPSPPPVASSAPRATPASPIPASPAPTPPVAAAPAQVAPPPPRPGAQLTAEEKAIADRIRSHPTAEGAVSSIRGQEMYRGIEIHYVPDQFGEKPTCQIEFNGTMADGRPIQGRKWFLLYVVSTAGMNRLYSENYFGTRNPLRMYVDDAAQFIEVPVTSGGDAMLDMTPALAARLAAARKVKILHGQGATGEISFTYDFTNFAHVRNIAMALCGPK